MTKKLISDNLNYPDFIKRHFTPEYEAKTITNPGKVELQLCPCQLEHPFPDGCEVYNWIKQRDLLKRSLSYGELKFYEENPDEIPVDFKDKWVYGWASVCVDEDDGRATVGGSAASSYKVPYLRCNVDRPYVRWVGLHVKCLDDGLAGFRVS